MRGLYDRFESCNNKVFLIYGQKLDEYYRELTDGEGYYEWGVQTAKEYNSYKSLFERRHGLVPENRPLYLRWIPQTMDREKQRYRSRIVYGEPFVREENPDAVYPGMPMLVYNNLTGIKQRLSPDDVRSTVIPSIWPSVYIDRSMPLVPNPRHRGFDTSVILLVRHSSADLDNNDLAAAADTIHVICDNVLANVFDVQSFARVFVADVVRMEDSVDRLTDKP